MKVVSSCGIIDILIKKAEQKLKQEGDEEEKESNIKEVEYLRGVKENCLSVNGIVEEDSQGSQGSYLSDQHDDFFPHWKR